MKPFLISTLLFLTTLSQLYGQEKTLLENVEAMMQDSLYNNVAIDSSSLVNPSVIINGVPIEFSTLNLFAESDLKHLEFLGPRQLENTTIYAPGGIVLVVLEKKASLKFKKLNKSK